MERKGGVVSDTTYEEYLQGRAAVKRQGDLPYRQADLNLNLETPLASSHPRKQNRLRLQDQRANEQRDSQLLVYFEIYQIRECLPPGELVYI